MQIDVSEKGLYLTIESLWCSSDAVSIALVMIRVALSNAFLSSASRMSASHCSAEENLKKIIKPHVTHMYTVVFSCY